MTKYVLYRFGSVEHEHKTLVLGRPKVFLLDADVGVRVDVLAVPRAFCSVCGGRIEGG